MSRPQPASPAPYRLLVRLPENPDDPVRDRTVQALLAVKEMKEDAARNGLMLRVDVTQLSAQHMADKRVKASLAERGVTNLPALTHADGVVFGAQKIRAFFSDKIDAALRTPRAGAGRPAARPPAAIYPTDPDEVLSDYYSKNLSKPDRDEEEGDSEDLTQDKGFSKRIEEDRKRREARLKKDTEIDDGHQGRRREERPQRQRVQQDTDDLTNLISSISGGSGGSGGGGGGGRRPPPMPADDEYEDDPVGDQLMDKYLANLEQSD